MPGCTPSSPAWVLAFALCICLAISACGVFGIRWKEEVQLANGKIILVKRTAHGKSLGEIGGAGGWEQSEMTLEIDDPSIAEQPPVWRFPFVPVLFDFDPQDQEWFVVATFYTCRGWYDLGRPKLPYVQYRARRGKWEVVPLEADLIGRKANLLTGISSGGEPPLVTLGDKQEREKSSGEKYKSIVGSWHTTC